MSNISWFHARNRVTAPVDPPFVPGIATNYEITWLALAPDGNIIVSGPFTTYKGVAANGLMKLTPSGVKLANPSPSGSVDSVGGSVPNPRAWLLPSGNYIMTGVFQYMAGAAANRIIGITATGQKDNSFVYGTGMDDQTCSAFVQPDGKIIIVGAFTTYKGSYYYGIVRLDTSGNVDSTLLSGYGFGSLVKSYNPFCVIMDGTDIIIGGNQIIYNGASSYNLTKISSTGTKYAYPASAISGPVEYMKIKDSFLYICGSFQQVGGVSRNRIARLNLSDGSLDTSFDPGASLGFDSRVIAFDIQEDGKIIAVGYFTTYRGSSRNRIVRINTDGTLDTSFVVGTGFDATTASVLILPSGKIMVAGYFTTYKGVAANHIICLNGDGSINS